MNLISIGVEEVKHERPDLYKTFFGKKYHHVDAFADWRMALLFSARIASDPEKFLSAKDSTPLSSYRNKLDALRILETWMDCDCTMFFVSRSIFEAVKRTRPPEAGILDELRLPLPATHFVLPKNGWQVGEHNVTNITISYREPSMALQITRRDVEPRFAIQTVFPDKYFAASLPLSHMRSLLRDGWDSYLANKGANLIISDPEGVQLFTELLRIAINLVMVMQVEPKLVQTGKRRGPCKKEKNRDIFEPHIIGARYRSETRNATATAPGNHSSPAMHWRIGHWRSQNHGTRQKLPDGKLGPFTEKPVRTWIKPILVNAPAGDDGGTAPVKT